MSRLFCRLGWHVHAPNIGDKWGRLFCIYCGKEKAR